MRICVLALVACLSVSPAFAGEIAILASGLQMHADRHEIADGVVRLYQKSGVTELPASAVARFEADFEPPPMASAKAPAPVPPESTLAPVIRDPKTLLAAAAAKSGLPVSFVESVAKVESGFRPKAVSPKGAVGVMQLMPATAQTLGADPHDVAQNIDAGTRLLRELLLKYEGDVVKALAAYNAGTGAVERFGGLPPYQETRQYVNRVIGAYLQSGGR